MARRPHALVMATERAEDATEPRGSTDWVLIFSILVAMVAVSLYR